MQRSFSVPQNKYLVPLLEKDGTDKIIGAALEVHRVHGSGLLELSYQVCLEHESKFSVSLVRYIEETL